MIDSKKAESDGAYEFKEIPLTSGNNEIKILFFGPFGEIEERVENYLMNSELTKYGDFNWRFSWSKQNQGLISLKKIVNTANKVNRFILETEYGLTPQLSLNTTLSKLPNADNTDYQEHINLTLRSTLGNLYSKHTLVKSFENPDYAIQTFYSFNIYDYDLSLDYRYFSKEIIKSPTNKSPLFNNSLRLHKQVETNLFDNFNYSFRLNERRNRGEDKIKNYSFNQLVKIKKLLINNNINYKKNSNANKIDGRLLFTLPKYHNYTLRGQYNYKLKPTYHSDSISFNIDRKFSDTLYASLNIEKSLYNENTTKLSFNLNKKFKRFNLGLNARYDTDNHYHLGISVSFNLDRHGLYAERRNNMGIFEGVVFLDRNKDNTFNQDDIPLPDVQFWLNQHAVKTLSDKQGKARFEIPAQETNHIKVSTGAYQNYYWRLEEPELHAISHPSKTIKAYFPAVLVGDIEGTVYRLFLKHNAVRELSGVTVELLDPYGEVIDTAVSSFDGFYLFERIPFGQYQVRIAEQTLTRLNMKSTPTLTVNLTMEEDISMGNDFTLQKHQRNHQNTP